MCGIFLSQNAYLFRSLFVLVSFILTLSLSSSILSRTEEKIHSDALMALDDGKSLRKLFQKPEEVAKEKTRRFAVLGITSIAVALVAVLLCWFVWNRAVLRSESTAAVLVVSD